MGGGGGHRGSTFFVDLQEIWSYSTIYNLAKGDKFTIFGQNLQF